MTKWPATTKPPPHCYNNYSGEPEEKPGSLKSDIIDAEGQIALKTTAQHQPHEAQQITIVAWPYGHDTQTVSELYSSVQSPSGH